MFNDFPIRFWTQYYYLGHPYMTERSCNAFGRLNCCCRSHRTLLQRLQTLLLLEPHNAPATPPDAATAASGATERMGPRNDPKNRKRLFATATSRGSKSSPKSRQKLAKNSPATHEQLTKKLTVTLLPLLPRCTGRSGTLQVRQRNDQGRYR